MTTENHGSCEGPPSEGEDPREVFRLQVLEDLEEERALLFRFIAVGEALTLTILARQIIISLMGG